MERKKILVEQLKTIYRQVVEQRSSFPDAFIWMSQQVINGRVPIEEEIFDPLNVYQMWIKTFSNMKLMHQIDSDKIRKLFPQALADKIGGLVDKDNAHQFFDMTERPNWVPISFKEHLKSFIKERFP